MPLKNIHALCGAALFWRRIVPRLGRFLRSLVFVHTLSRYASRVCEDYLWVANQAYEVNIPLLFFVDGRVIQR